MEFPDLVVRTYRGFADAEQVATLVNVARAAGGDDRPPVRAEAVHDFFTGSAADADPTWDIHLFFANGELVAYERTRRETWVDGRRVYHVMPFVHPGWKARHDLREIVERIVAYQADAAAHDASGGSAFLSAVPDPSDHGMIDALRNAGFEPRHFFFRMACPLAERPTESPIPDGIEVRSVAEGDQRAIYRFDRRIMAGAWGVEAPTDEHFAWWADEAFLNPELWRVAWHRDDIVGTAAGAIGGTWTPDLGGETAEIRFVRVAPPWRRKGLATSLIRSCMAALWDIGVRRLVLGVDGDSEDSAVALYRSLGFEVVSRLIAYCRDIGPGSAC